MATVTKFATGKYAYAICDVCGVSYRYSELRTTTIRGKDTHVKACPECWDADHPQNFLPEAIHVDGQALRDPRPEDDYRSRILPHWRPVDAFLLPVHVGEVEVITS